VDLTALGADFYAGNCQEGKTFSERIEEQGTRDPAAWFAVPEAIRFQVERDWDDVRDRCRRLVREARDELCDLLGTEPLAPETMVAQMSTVRLPHPAAGLSVRLFTRDRVEIPVGGRENDLLRLSVAAYTTRDDIDRLLAALVRELDAEHRQQDE
jgi:isopenicillin-N epimerase